MLTVEVEPPGGGFVIPESGEFKLNETITLSARPANGDWFFETWSGQVDPDADWSDTKTTVTMDKNRTISAHFFERPGLLKIDMFGDMEFSLASIDSSNDLYTFDLNEISYNDDAAPKFVANGVPDAVELHLLEAVLRNPKLSLTARSGIGHIFAWEAWRTNLLRIQRDAPNIDARIQRVVAGYITLGDYMSVEFIPKGLATHFQVTGIDSENYDRSMSRYLTYNEDADNDGFLNNEEWGHSISTLWPERADVYVAIALQPRQNNPRAPQLPLAPIDPNVTYSRTQ
ncbi:MAG: hypothetical protein SGI88_07260 [Candidatus Hydrogenedentes bacterium]|nr:hypothetical protein [Candidatus Hydrogenedentota bacterium]